MRALMLVLALTTFALPALADCGATHQASTPNTVATTTPPPAPTPGPSSGG